MRTRAWAVGRLSVAIVPAFSAWAVEARRGLALSWWIQVGPLLVAWFRRDPR